MIRALWLLIRLGLIVGIAIWIAERPGTVAIDWMSYSLSTPFGIFLLGLCVVILTALLVHRLVLALVSVPERVLRFREDRLRKKGFRALTKGFVAIAAGDAQQATQCANQARALIPDINGLVMLLEAQAARLRGEEGTARRTFQDLLQDKDAAFFGIRGLLNSTLEANDTPKALEYARQALGMYPKQAWLLRTVYALEIREHRWSDALDTLKKGLKSGAMDADRARSDEVAILLQQAEEDLHQGQDDKAYAKTKKAWKRDPLFVPAVTRLAAHYIKRGKNRKAASIVETVWKHIPHPDLVKIWDALAPENKPSDAAKRLRWYEKLLSLRPDSAEGQISAARAAMNDQLWGEARAYLTIAERIEPSADLYRLWAEVEENSARNPASIRAWLEKAADAPHGKAWTCSETGRLYEEWSPIAQPHGSFNTIVWDYPMNRMKSAASLIAPGDLLLDPAA